MSRFSFAFAAAAVIFFSGAAFAARQEFPEVREVKPVTDPLKEGATSQAAVSAAIHTIDFDVFSSIDDPLYREGSRRLLEKAVKEDAPKKAAVKKSGPPKAAPALRDAPISRPALKKVLKLRKTRAKDPVHTDPVKLKKSL